MIKVFVVDDHAVVRSGIKMFLDQLEGMTVVGEASNGHSAIDELRILSRHGDFPDVVLMDLMMPGMGGLETTDVVKREFPDLHVVILSTFDETEHVRNALEAGASGFFERILAPTRSRWPFGRSSLAALRSIPGLPAISLRTSWRRRATRNCYHPGSEKCSLWSVTGSATARSPIGSSSPSERHAPM